METLGEKRNYKKDHPISDSESLEFDKGECIGRTPT